MRTRILHVLDNLGNGGLQNGLSNIIDRLEPGRFEHILCAIRPVEAEHTHPFTADRVKEMCIGAEGKLGRTQFPAIVRAIRRWQPDIVHSRNWAAIEAVPAARYTGGCSVLHSEHGIDRDTMDNEPRRRSLFRRLAFELSHRVVCVSSEIRDLHARRTGFLPRRIQVIHNGVDNVRFTRSQEVRSRMRGELGIAPEEFCFGSVGNLVPVKDHLTTLHAFARLARDISNWRLILAGDGPELSALKTFLDSHPHCKTRVSFLGRSQRIPELLNAMDGYVLSSITEGINNSLLEAMATGLPVVATRTGGNPEVVVHEETGFLFDVGNAEQMAAFLHRIYTQRDLRERFGAAAVRRVQTEFSMASMVGNYEQLYTSLARSAGTPVGAAAGA